MPIEEMAAEAIRRGFKIRIDYRNRGWYVLLWQQTAEQLEFEGCHPVDMEVAFREAFLKLPREA